MQGSDAGGAFYARPAPSPPDRAPGEGAQGLPTRGQAAFVTNCIVPPIGKVLLKGIILFIAKQIGIS